MRAVRVHRHGEPADALVVDDDVPVPEPGPEQVRVRVEATALSMPDVMLCRGGYPLTPRELPFVPGMEGSGVVTELGSGVPAACIRSPTT
jgi:NADPH2:quinone reductase